MDSLSDLELQASAITHAVAIQKALNAAMRDGFKFEKAAVNGIRIKDWDETVSHLISLEG